MPILKRNKLVRYDYKPSAVPVLHNIQQTSSLYNLYAGKKVTPHILVNLLEFLHKQKGYKLLREPYTYTGEATKLIKKYGEGTSIKLLIEAAKVANHSWSFKFVNKVGVEIYGSNEEHTKKTEQEI